MYAEVALAHAVRQVFTYSLSPDLSGVVGPGMRVWVPFGQRKAIGMVVRVHSDKPGFDCKPVLQALDTEPVLTADMLDLTRWVSQYYYAAWGEVIQAALPAGFNYTADRYVSVLNRSGLTP